MQKENIVTCLAFPKTYEYTSNSFDNNFPTEICQYYELVTQNKVSV